MPDDNEDNAPFQIDLGVQGKQLYHLPEPLLVGDHLSKGILNCSETLLGIVGDLFEVSLALEETASGLFDITLAQEEDCPRVPDQAEASRLFICLLSRNKYFGTF